MGYSSNVYKKAADRLAQRKIRAEREADERRQEIYRLLPRAEELQKGITSSGIKAARAVIGGGDVKKEMERLRGENLAMQSELASLLQSNGYREDVFEPDYRCKRCSDTGYYDENGRTLVCPCLRQTLAECACEELNRFAPLSLSTFETFRLEYYSTDRDSNGLVPREHMEKVLRFCKGYAYNFHPGARGLLMCGATGLGKTHLSLAIANEVIKRGYGVIYVSAPSVIEQFEKRMRSWGESNELLDMVNDCDLLIIDDLGTEYKNQFSVAHIYNLINSRLLAHKAIIISTNLSMKELESHYSNRLVSRLNGEVEKLNFLGRDIRVAKKNQRK